MSSLLNFRFDQFVLDQITQVGKTDTLANLLSISLFVLDIVKEKEFLTTLFGIKPLFENDHTIVLPLLNGMTLSLQAILNRDTSGFDDNEVNGEKVELDFQVVDIQTFWQITQTHQNWQTSGLKKSRTGWWLKVKSPSGMLLGFWQKV
jgi:hypothetical protein